MEKYQKYDEAVRVVLVVGGIISGMFLILTLIADDGKVKNQTEKPAWQTSCPERIVPVKLPEPVKPEPFKYVPLKLKEVIPVDEEKTETNPIPSPVQSENKTTMSQQDIYNAILKLEKEHPPLISMPAVSTVSTVYTDNKESLSSSNTVSSTPDIKPSVTTSSFTSSLSDSYTAPAVSQNCSSSYDGQTYAPVVPVQQIVKPDAYGLSIGMNQYGTPVQAVPADSSDSQSFAPVVPVQQIVKPDAYGPGIGMNQYGTPVKFVPVDSF